MRWPWRRRKAPAPLLCSEPGCGRPAVDHRSPLDDDNIGPGHPLWPMFELAMKTGEPVMAVYNNETGEIVSLKAIKDDDPHIGNGRAKTPDDIPEQPDRFER